MPLTVRLLAEAVAVLGVLGSLCFCMLAACALVNFLRDRREKICPQEQNRIGGNWPPVSILKPLKGVDRKITECFRSHAEQDYPEFELIFGVSDPADPACDAVRTLQKLYPDRRIKLVVCERILGANIKVSNLAQMLPAAAHEILLVNDSDILVSPDYLQRVVKPLGDPQVGLVTCLYRAEAAPSLGSRLEALSIATDFVPGVLSARLLEKGLRFGLGSTLAFRRADLASIGGFEAFVDYLADDYELGRRIASAGKQVELSDAVVTTIPPAYTLGEFWQHQLRWSRTIRDARRWGYLGLVFTFALPWSLAAVIAARGATWAWCLFALVYAARLAVALVTTTAVLHDRQSLRDIFWLPLRDLLAPLVWAGGLMGNRIHWRGDEFYLKNGQLFRVSAEAR